ncbi:response regulator transcription factor [Bradyrhizobium cenepequi]
MLIVDDDEAVRNSLTFSLQAEGFQVQSYSDPHDLLKEMPKLPPANCLVINYQMPTISGLELIVRLRAAGVSLPAFLVSGHMSESMRQRASEVGVTLVEKPFSDRLMASIRKVLT